MCIICDDMVINWNLLIVVGSTVIGLLIGAYLGGRTDDDEVSAWIILGGIVGGLLNGLLWAFAPAFTLGAGVSIALAYLAFRLGRRSQ